MDEADLLKERLQAITDKRRIQEDIARKRRLIEEEKLKFQYIKKKALREQWLMDGLSQQTEQEQEAMRLQAQDEQQQSDLLQSNILRIEGEIETLEAQELSISANEEVVLKRLKEVERTAEDIIKELNAEYLTDVTHRGPSPLPDIPSFYTVTPAESPPICRPGSEEPKIATFAVEINVEHDKRTGKSQVVSTASITPETILGRGLKVFDDGRKSVYALHPDGGQQDSGAVGEMTPTEVEELLRQATDKKVPTEVQYHQPVYSVPYTGSSRPSTPKTPNKSQRQTPTSSPSPFHSAISSRDGAQVLAEENGHRQDLEGWKSQSKTPSPGLIQQDPTSRVHKSGELPYLHIPGQPRSDKSAVPQSNIVVKPPRGLANSGMDTSSPHPAALVSVKARSEGMPAAIQPVYRTVDSHSPPLVSLKAEGDLDAFIETSGDFNTPSNSCADELESGPVTMIFMGYKNADDDDEEEEEDVQAELIVIASSDEDDDKAMTEDSDGEESLSFHPEGYRSRVFQPRVGVAKVSGRRETIEDAYAHREDLGLHKPTFTHKPGKHSPYLRGRGGDESANAGSINMEKMKLCTTGR
ncbi:palmdelphin isoform X3 [Scophthalmus maximus]|uniref:palmdelphin isoform X3 n=1 Tax=Scophthalmus maximus TaxID=52904 RepID=UPI001FA92C89|nr:palmdelphin isoform X3 [Scophthalmus maximus]